MSAAFHVSSGDELARVASYGGERTLLARLIACARAGDVVYDVGANIGLYTVFLAKAVGPKGAVIGFEPERRACGRALANLELNALGNAKMFDVALGAERISVQLSVDPSGLGTTCISPHLRGAVVRNQQAADMVRGDDYIQEHGLPRPAIVKVDVEGFEYETLLGLSRALRHPVCRLVACEVHFATLARMGHSDTPRKIEALLAEFGFDHLEWVNSSHVVAIKTCSGEEPCACTS